MHPDRDSSWVFMTSFWINARPRTGSIAVQGSIMFVPLLLSGPGKLSLDHWIARYADASSHGKRSSSASTSR
jgi:hypothetical protein